MNQIRFNQMIRFFRSVLLLLGLWWLSGVALMAQCSQCKAAAGTTDENGNLAFGSTLNTGILYLLALPVFLPIIVGVVWWYLRKQRAQETAS